MGYNGHLMLCDLDEITDIHNQIIKNDRPAHTNFYKSSDEDIQNLLTEKKNTPEVNEKLVDDFLLALYLFQPFKHQMQFHFWGDAWDLIHLEIPEYMKIEQSSKTFQNLWLKMIGNDTETYQVNILGKECIMKGYRGGFINKNEMNEFKGEMDRLLSITNNLDEKIYSFYNKDWRNKYHGPKFRFIELVHALCVEGTEGLGWGKNTILGYYGDY